MVKHFHQWHATIRFVSCLLEPEVHQLDVNTAFLNGKLMLRFKCVNLRDILIKIGQIEPVKFRFFVAVLNFYQILRMDCS